MARSERGQPEKRSAQRASDEAGDAARDHAGSQPGNRASSNRASSGKQPLGSELAAQASSPLPVVRVPRARRAAKVQPSVCVVCDSPQRASNARLLALLHGACEQAGILPRDVAASDVEASPEGDAPLMLAIVDPLAHAQPPQGCVLVCDSVQDAVLRASFACCATGILTREDLLTQSVLIAKLREARELLATRAAQQRPLAACPKPARADNHARDRAAQRASDRAARLLRAARSIAASRDALAGQLAMVCEQLSQSCMDVSSQLQHVALSSELQTLLRQDLDIESVLRTSLEFMLRKLGATNAAIYLPSASGDYTLGAYINYDCPRDGIEHTLDHLGDALVPLYSDRPGLHVLASCEHDLPTITSAWVAESSMLVHSAHAEDECVAIVAVFRDQAHGFDAEGRKLVATTGQLLGQQLARIVKTHQRWKAA